MFNEFRNGIYEIKCMILVLFRLLDVADLTNTLNLSLSQNKKNKVYPVSPTFSVYCFPECSLHGQGRI